MGISYNHSDNMCRCNRISRLYESIHDATPSTDYVLDSGIVFISGCNINIGGKTFYQITEDTGSNNLPLGYWCVIDTLDILPIETSNDAQDVTLDDTVDVNETLYVNGDKTIVYNKSDSLTPFSNELKVGDIIICDKVMNYNNNGLVETRYHISDVTAPDADKSIIGMWVVANYSVSFTNHTDFIPSAPLLRTFATPNGPVAAPRTLATVKFPPAPTTIPLAKPRSKYDNMSAAEIQAEKDGQSMSQDIVTDSNDYTDVARISLNSKKLYEAYGFNYTYANSTSLMDVPLGRMLFVHGMPFQYTHITDRRGNSKLQYGASSEPEYKAHSGDTDMYGRTFAKEIAANMPIVVFAPGIPRFLTRMKESVFGYMGDDAKSKNAWMPFWGNMNSDDENDALKKLAENGGNYDYYSMSISTADYFQYVNALCQNSARLMGLNNVEYRGKKCDEMLWDKYNSSADQDYNTFESVMGLSGGVSFAFDPLSSISDTLSNTTGESRFSGMLNGLSSTTRELEFIAGQNGVNIGLIGLIDSQEYEAATASVRDGFGSGFINAFSRVSSFMQNSAHGMNVRFPEIWQESSNTKSYDLEMHFITPYATTFCKWRYVLVPFFHIFALTAPKSPTTLTNYERPFLIRAFSKGYFNIEMGIIESLTWRRFGDGDMISEDGVPTQIDVSVSMKDMYHTLAMSKNGVGVDGISKIGVFFNNTGLMDMLGTLSGVNMNRITLAERLSLYSSSAVSSFSSIGNNFLLHFADRARTVTEKYIVGL